MSNTFFSGPDVVIDPSDPTITVGNVSSTTAANPIITPSLAEGVNIGEGATLFAGGVADVLRFKTLLAGAGIALSYDADTITISTGTLTHGDLSFFSLLETGATVMQPNTVVFCDSVGKLQFTSVPNAGQVLMFDGHEFVWTAASGATRVTSVDVYGGPGIIATGGPITSEGIIDVFLAPSGVIAGDYVAPKVTIDTYGRITFATDVGMATTSTAGLVMLASQANADGGLTGYVLTPDNFINMSSSQPLANAIRRAVLIDHVVTNPVLATMPPKTVKGNKTTDVGDADDISASDVLDMIGSAQGAVLYRSSSTWKALGVGSSGQLLISGGSGADVRWGSISFADVTGIAAPSQLPGYVGDATVAAGTNVITFNTVVTPGIYQTLTVNAKGLVTAGRLLTQPDIPVFYGAAADADGSKGGVPIPVAGQENYFLRGDSSWQPIPVQSQFTCGPTAPETANLGDRWFDTTNNVLFTYVTDGSGGGSSGPPNCFWFSSP